MRRIVIILAALCALAGTSAMGASAATWPAHCKTMKCVNRHLNALHKASRAQAATLADLLSTNPPTNNVLQGQIDQLGQTDQNQWSQIAGVENTVNCFTFMPVSRFVNQGGTVDTTRWWPFSLPPDDGLLDFERSGQPNTGVVYSFVTDPCAS